MAKKNKAMILLKSEAYSFVDTHLDSSIAGALAATHASYENAQVPSASMGQTGRTVQAHPEPTFVPLEDARELSASAQAARHAVVATVRKLKLIDEKPGTWEHLKYRGVLDVPVISIK